MLLRASMSGCWQLWNGRTSALLFAVPGASVSCRVFLSCSTAAADAFTGKLMGIFRAVLAEGVSQVRMPHSQS